jgi:hypothetical protein
VNPVAKCSSKDLLYARFRFFERKSDETFAAGEVSSVGEAKQDAGNLNATGGRDQLGIPRQRQSLNELSY